MRAVLGIQAVVIGAFGVAWARGSSDTRARVAEVVTGHLATPNVPVAREVPLRVQPLYNDSELVSDAELAAVLKQLRPKFAPKHLKPNFVEHALRIWGVDAKFAEKGVMSGEEMKNFLVDHGRYLTSWGDAAEPLLIEDGEGVRIRWGKQAGGSVHHDHWLASLTEAGVPLNEPVFTPAHHQKSINAVLQQALRDFRLDEREVEWSAMAFGLWIPPQKTWTTSDGRQLSFDLLARRLMRGARNGGVCQGTHRIYSMALLVRLDDEFSILSPEVRGEVLDDLRKIRDLLIVSQFKDGHWPSNWPEGEEAVKKPIDDPLYRKVISTGHHLEWLAIAPRELHPPHEQILKAARWAIDTTVEQTPEGIQERYTFFSHVAGALSLWRSTRPSEFWQAWEKKEKDEGGRMNKKSERRGKHVLFILPPSSFRLSK